MMRLAALIGAGLIAASAAAAAEYPLISLRNTDFVVFVGFALFIAILMYYKVPRIVIGMLDKRAEGIRADLDEARALREEATTLLASYERKHQDVQQQADRIVAAAREEAQTAGERAKADLEMSIERRVRAAEDRIASAESAAVQAVRDRAIQVAVAAASDVLARQMDAARSDRLVDDAIETVGAKLH